MRMSARPYRHLSGHIKLHGSRNWWYDFLTVCMYKESVVRGRAELAYVARERDKEVDRSSCMLRNGKNVLDLPNCSLRLLVVKLLDT